MASQRKKFAFFILGAIPLLPTLALAFMSFSAQRPENLGVHADHLAACSNTPNCVSSESQEPQHKITPLPLQGSTTESINRLKQILSEYSNATMITSSPNYLHVEFTSALFRFVDDVEFFYNENDKVIHFRSASRVGHSDFGANRKRMQKITAAYKKNLP